MKVLVCGGRNYRDRQRVFAELLSLHLRIPITLVIHGGASGADGLAHSWAERFGVQSKVFQAAWDKHGKAAGPIRNSQMLLENPDLVLAFPGGRGTADMVNKAKNAGVQVLFITD